MTTNVTVTFSISNRLPATPQPGPDWVSSAYYILYEKYASLVLHIFYFKPQHSLPWNKQPPRKNSQSYHYIITIHGPQI